MTGKIRRLVNVLVPHASKSNMDRKHAACVVKGGKPVSFGFNHDRMTSKNKFIMTFHAEVHAINSLLNIKKQHGFSNYLNDTLQTMSYRKSPILKGAQTI